MAMRVFQFRRTQRKYKAGQGHELASLRAQRSAAGSAHAVAPARSRSGLVPQRGATIAMIYRLPLRQTEGFIASLFELGGVELSVPDHTTVSRWFRRLRRKRMARPVRDQPLHLVVDSSGLTIHVGKSVIPPRRRAWRKIHLAVDRQRGTILACHLGASSTRDSDRVRALLGQIKTRLSSFSADSAYDRARVYGAVTRHSRDSRLLIAPRRHARLDIGKRASLRQRDEYIWRMREIGRRAWYLESGITKRSTVENVFYRYKSVLGREMKARTLAGSGSKPGSAATS